MVPNLKFLIIFWLLSLQFYPQNDMEGNKDHPLVPRFPGSEIVYYEKTENTTYEFALGPLAKSSERDEYQLTDTRKLLGTVVRIQYRSNEKDVSKVFNYYEHSLKANGFELTAVTKAAKPTEAAGRNWTLAVFKDLNYKYKSNIAGTKSGDENRYFIAGNIHRVNQKANLAMIINKFDKEEVYIHIDIISPDSGFEEEKILNAEEMAIKLNEKGYAIINGIYFEANSADVLEGSDEALREVAEYLKNNRGVSLYVVGHTGMQGNLDFQIALSKSMADAVIKILAGKYNISPGRLTSRGVGALSPITTNQNVEGRNINRRIELVFKNF
jgi:OmpA-OmpF porin, OOP family